MIRILEGKSVRRLDQLHCERTGKSSLELMEHAAKEFCSWFEALCLDTRRPLYVYVGAGNNGGDGLAIARRLSGIWKKIHIVCCFKEPVSQSPDFRSNWERLPRELAVTHYSEVDLPKDAILIDAFLGVGWEGSLRDSAKAVIQSMKRHSGLTIAVDIPSGLESEGVAEKDTLAVAHTVSFAFPKQSLLLPENSRHVGQLSVLDIGIDEDVYDSFDSRKYYVQAKDIPALHRSFDRFSHKGDFGKILLIGGSPGKMGALYLSSRSALRTGAGLVTCLVDASERAILQVSLPEAMVAWNWEELDFSPYTAIGIGPGWGIHLRKETLKMILESYQSPMVLDADALTLLSQNLELVEEIPPNSILTPHVGEFERLVGFCSTHSERIRRAGDFARRYSLILVLKGANTLISFPDGRQFFNSTGTNYMATAGSGDVLTGVITALLGMGYSPENAAICGVFHHGLAGELAGAMYRRGTIASDILEQLPTSFIQLGIR